MPSPSTPYSSDYWLYTYLYNPLAAHLCFIHPNWITFAALLLTIPVVGALLRHSPLWCLVLLFTLRAALDCMDGAVARSCKSTSEGGALFDKISDNIFLAAAIATLVYCASVKHGLTSWKTGLLGILGGMIVTSTLYEAHAVHAGSLTDAMPITRVIHDNYTLFNGLSGALVWWLANRF